MKDLMLFTEKYAAVLIELEALKAANEDQAVVNANLISLIQDLQRSVSIPEIMITLVRELSLSPKRGFFR